MPSKPKVTHELRATLFTDARGITSCCLIMRCESYAMRTGSFETVLGKIGFDEKGDVTGISAFIWYVFGKEDYSPVK